MCGHMAGDGVLSPLDIQEKECVAIWPGDGVLTTHYLGKGESVAIWTDEVLTAHKTQKGEYVAICPVTEYWLPMISEKENVWPYGSVTEY
ncbi:hypothetical protein BgiBS90_038358 [Biomphalaria glabrata]|nr:hypothetical protein BgiBS90_038358 [Biomphalaria glabrata]